MRPLEINHRNLDALVPIIVLLFTFSLSLICGSVFWLPKYSSAVTGLTLASPTPTLSLSTSSPQVNIEILPTPQGTLSSNSHNIVTNTNLPTGYSLSLSLSSTPNPTLPPSTNTNHLSPSALSTNTWGYNTTGSTTLFSGASSTPTTIKTTNQSTTTNPSTSSTQVSYAAKVDTSIPAGTYNNTVTYTATTNTSTLPSPTITSITSSAGTTSGIPSGTTAGGTSITIVGTGFTLNDQSITTNVTLDNLSCASVSISSNTPTAGQDTIYCSTPVHATAGAVDVSITTWAEQNGAGLGTVTSSPATGGGYTFVAPTVTITSPTQGQIYAAGTTSTNLTVTTNIPAICYIGTSTNPTTPMTTTGNGTTTGGSTTHSQTITGLTNQSTNTRYIRCAAATGHSYSTPTTGNTITFYVRAQTPAAPTGSGLTPASNATVNNGTTTITVTSTTAGATCTWGETAQTATSNASGTTRTTTTGTNTLYYSCIVGAGNANTQSNATTGSWSYVGVAPKLYMQTITSSNCPTTRTRANDARDDATYWIQKMADNKCWMLTNLAYAGGGTNTYNDTKTITNTNALSYTEPYYMIPTGSNKTVEPQDPSTSTSGTGQYGYLYNWCAAMGGQTTTSACMNATTPLPDQNISICPSGWRLPTGGTGGEYQSLATAIGATNNAAGSTALRSSWLGMYSGGWANGFYSQGSYGYYWSSTQYTAAYAYNLAFNSSGVYPGTYNDNKRYGFAVRCLAL